jgi:hypothetical protein
MRRERRRLRGRAMLPPRERQTCDDGAGEEERADERYASHGYPFSQDELLWTVKICEPEPRFPRVSEAVTVSS